MIWKKEKLRPSQPFFVLDTEDFKQEVYLKQGISHFYTFHVDEPKTIYAVPDGCIDISFEYAEGKLKGYVCGTVLSIQGYEWEVRKDVFAIRFMPGMQPAMLSMKMKDLVGKKIPLELALTNSNLLELLKDETDFYQRIRIFLQEFTKAENKKEKPFGKRELVMSVKQLVYESDGKIKVSELQDQTGYTERYINKVFIEEMGFSPKIFCKIIQFQRALEFLNYGAPDKMADAAVFLGYYDQPQFIRDFKNYAGITPNKYLKLIESRKYAQLIQNTGFLN